MYWMGGGKCVTGITSTCRISAVMAVRGSTRRSFGRNGLCELRDNARSLCGQREVTGQQRGPVRSSPRPLKHIYCSSKFGYLRLATSGLANYNLRVICDTSRLMEVKWAR